MGKKRKQQKRNAFHIVPFVSTKSLSEERNVSVEQPRPNSKASSHSSTRTSESRSQQVKPFVVEATKKYSEKRSKVSHFNESLEKSSSDSDGISNHGPTVQSPSRQPHFLYCEESDDHEESSEAEASNKFKRQRLEITEISENRVDQEHSEELDSDDDDDSDSSDTPENNFSYRVFQAEDSDFLIVGLKPETNVIFCGKALISVIYGGASTMCYQMSPNNEPVPIYAPFCSQLPIIKATKFGSEGYLKLKLVKEKLNELFDGEFEMVKEILKYIEDRSTLVLLKPVVGKYDLKVREINRLFSLPKKKRYFKLYEKFGFAVGPSQGRWSIKVDEWEPAVKHVTKAVETAITEGNDLPRILVCGESHAGKSSLIRFMINSTVKICDSVLHFEGDPGQTEFTPSGLVSLTKVQTPLLGLPFTHQQAPLVACYVGGKTVEANPALYSESLKCIAAYYEAKHSDLPLFVNTMGWVQHIGLALLVDLIRIIRPNIIIQFRSRGIPLLSEEYLETAFGWSTPRQETYLNFELITLRKLSRSAKHITLFPDKNRELACAHYIDSAKRTAFDDSKSLLSRTPYEVSLKSVALHACFCELSVAQLMDAMNASWVALCSIDEDLLITDPDAPDYPKMVNFPAVNRWIGFGLVRGIDDKKQTILISTPVSLTKMQNVNALLIGIDDLPTSLFLRHGAEGHIPYMCEFLTATAEYKRFSPWNRRKYKLAKKGNSPSDRMRKQLFKSLRMSM